MLDRLVRQGRAFGIHVHPRLAEPRRRVLARAKHASARWPCGSPCNAASQTRHLILSEENSRGPAAHPPRRGDLQRPERHGRREQLLPGRLALRRAPGRLPPHELRELTKDRADRPPRPQIVFEGNLPAVASKNPLCSPLTRRCRNGAPPRRPTTPGSARRSRSKTRRPPIFRPQSGSNVLDRWSKRRRWRSACSRWRSSASPPSTRPRGVGFYLFDGTARRFASRRPLPTDQGRLPHAVRSVTQRELPNILGAIAAEIDRRQKTDEPDAPKLFTSSFYDLSRLRDLRKSDDDFGFGGGYGEPKVDPPAKLFSNILRDGPPARRAYDRLVRQPEQPQSLVRPPGLEGIRTCAFSSRCRRMIPARSSTAPPPASSAKTERFISARKKAASKNSGPTAFPTPNGSRRFPRAFRRQAPAPIELPVTPPPAPVAADGGLDSTFGAVPRGRKLAVAQPMSTRQLLE